MRLVIGGYAQGKLGFVLRSLVGRDYVVGAGERPGAGDVWGDGEVPGDEELRGDEEAPGDKELQGDGEVPGDEGVRGDGEVPGDEELWGHGESPENGKLSEDGEPGGRFIIVNHFHRWVKRRLTDGGCPEEEIGDFLERYGECAIICDEIGNGIVPGDRFEREYRERTGRILIDLAARAERVERVICGIGQRIK